MTTWSSAKPPTAFCSVATGLYDDCQRLFLLPQGEGKDEGEANMNLTPSYLHFAL